MRKTKLAPNYSWKNGEKKESEDEIRGIWAKIYIGGEFVMDFARPENLPQKTKWQGPTFAAISPHTPSQELSRKRERFANTLPRAHLA